MDLLNQQISGLKAQLQNVSRTPMDHNIHSCLDEMERVNRDQQNTWNAAKLHWQTEIRQVLNMLRDPSKLQKSNQDAQSRRARNKKAEDALIEQYQEIMQILYLELRPERPFENNEDIRMALRLLKDSKTIQTSQDIEVDDVYSL